MLYSTTFFQCIYNSKTEKRRGGREYLNLEVEHLVPKPES